MSSALDCMPSGLTSDIHLTDCPKTRDLLTSLAVFNAWGAILAAIFGHDYIRTKLPSCSFSKSWGPWSSIALVCIHPFLMVISTYTIRLNGFDPVPILVFAVWTIRPRLVITPLLWLSFHICGGRKGGNNPYLWTFKDNVVEETLLNIFSLPFALLFIKLRDDTDEYGCASQPAYQHFWNSFYLMAAVGAISLIILFFMVIHGCCGRNKDEESLSLFWKLTLFFAGLNMFAGFAGQWLLWGTFISNAGTDFCPGSLVGEIASWAIGLAAIALGRAFLGGPSSN